MILVVGGSGFIGTRLCERLRKSGRKFEIFDKQLSKEFEKNCRQINICDLDHLLSQKPFGKTDVLVNLAAEHRDDIQPISLYDDVNVQGARNICRYAAENRINNIVFTSSVAVYGFAERGTDESGKINPFNDYGRTKYEAEQIYKNWQAESPTERTLTIIRPTVVFGERNRGNVYNLFKQIASGRFVMIGNGRNCKSMAYVENVAAFIEYNFRNSASVHTYNYVDKPDFDMKSLIFHVKNALGIRPGIGFRVPYIAGLAIGYGFDLIAKLLNRKLPISSIRIKKFCSESTYQTAVCETAFVPPVDLKKAIEKTIQYEFILNTNYNRSNPPEN